MPVDGDEPLMSGSGVVSKDVTDDDLLDSWHEALTKWHQQLKQKPKQVRVYLYVGVNLQLCSRIARVQSCKFTPTYR